MMIQVKAVRLPELSSALMPETFRQIMHEYVMVIMVLVYALEGREDARSRTNGTCTVAIAGTQNSA